MNRSVMDMSSNMNLSDRIKQYQNVFGESIKKELIIKEDNRTVFNTGIHRDENGKYYLYARVPTHHTTYPSWIRLYVSDDGTSFKEKTDHFISPGYTIEEYSYGCEDDRCSKVDDWFAHTYSMLLANNVETPRRDDASVYIGVSLGRTPDEAVFAGIVNIKENKDAACIKPSDKMHLIHRPRNWTPISAVWSGDFDKGLAKAKDIYYSNSNAPETRKRIPRLEPPSKNRVLCPLIGSFGKDARIGLGAPPMKDNGEYLFTYHVRDVPYQYWWSMGIMNEVDGQLKIKKILPFPVCIPDTPWEMIGDVPKVSFIGGLTEKDRMLEAWIGAADNYILKATINKDYMYSVIDDHGIDETEIDKVIEKYVKDNEKAFRKNKLIDPDWINKIAG